VRRSKTSRTRELFEAAGLPAADAEALTPEQQAERAKQQDKEVEAAAVRLLSRREHSTEELKRKLAAKGYPEASVATVIDKLGQKKWVSDERFAASYVHHHARRGQGPVRIRAELRQQGITDTQIQQEIAGGEQDWNGLAAEVRRRKFGAELPAILITADRSPAVRDAARANDIQVLNKPLKPAALRALMAQWRVQRIAAAE